MVNITATITSLSAKMSTQLLACFYCHKIEKSISGLVTHAKMEKRLPYKCSITECATKSFSNLETFRTHLKRHRLCEPLTTIELAEEEDSVPFEMESKFIFYVIKYLNKSYL